MKNFNFSDEQKRSLYRINEVIDEVEKRGIDLTDTYDKWLRIGLAIANEFGEDGRVIFHRVSKTYSKYDVQETDKKYDNLVKSAAVKRDGMPTCATIFYYAKEAGIELKGYRLPVDFDSADAESPLDERVLNGQWDEVDGIAEEEDEEEMVNMPEWIFDLLPPMLKKPVLCGKTKQERELLLLGSITAFSAVLPMFYSVYGNKKVSANLFFYAEGEASSGKGILEFCKKLVRQVHKKEVLISESLKSEYKMKMADFQKNKCNGPEPEKPKMRKLLMPANTTATSLYQHLAENNKGLLIMDTEGDTMLRCFSSDYGNYSEGLRKSFHNEEISYSRRTEDEFVTIQRPRLSVILSGTPSMVQKMFPSVEDGLFSRFMFYHLPMVKEWRNEITAPEDNGMDEVFMKSSKEFYRMYERLIDDNILYKFHVTDEQNKKFNDMFSEIKPEFIKIYDKDIASCIHRAGLICYRIAMVLTALRCWENGAFGIEPQKMMMSEKFVDLAGGKIEESAMVEEYEEQVRLIPCGEVDFKIACEIMKVVLQHVVRVYQQIPKQKSTYKSLYQERYKRWYEKLGKRFTAETAQKVAAMCNIATATYYKQINKLLTDKCIVQIGNKEFEKKRKEYPYVGKAVTNKQ